jgi:hypothetical protein
MTQSKKGSVLLYLLAVLLVGSLFTAITGGLYLVGTNTLSAIVNMITIGS